MVRPRFSRTTVTVAVLALTALGLTACSIPLSAEARDQWKRTYTLEKGGSLEIRNTNGEIRVETTDGDKVEVVADRVARAGSDAEAKTALGRIEITETATANRILLDSSKGGVAFEMNVSKHVDYVVHLPKWAAVTLSATNGEITVRGVGGALKVETTNGKIDGADLSGPVHL